MFIFRELKDIPSGELPFKKNRLYEQHRNNYTIPCTIRTVQEKTEIILIFTFLNLMYNIYSNSVKISEI